MNDSTVAATKTIKEEAETSPDSLTIDVEGHDDHEEGQSPMMKVHELKSEFDPVQGKAWVNAIRTHVVVPLIRFRPYFEGAKSCGMKILRNK